MSSGKPKCYGMRHRGFGDSLALFAAAHIFSQITGEPTHAYCWDAFRYLADYYDGVVWHDPNQLADFEVHDSGIEPYDYKRFNSVSWSLRNMTKSEVAPDSDIHMNIGRDPHPDAISIVPVGNINGAIGVKTLEAMLARSRILFPNYPYRLIGHCYPIEQYKSLIDQYHVADERTDDRTCHVVMAQLRKSALLICPHTGPTFAAIGLNVPVYCERSKNRNHDYLLDLGPGRVTFFDESDQV